MRATSILNPQPRLRHPSERRPRHRAAAQDDDDPRAGAVHAVQGLLAGAGLCLQAQPSGRAQADQDYGKRSAVVLVAGGAMKSPFRTTIRGSHSQDEISATTASDKVGNQPALR
jgi:hypothetical protein